MYDANYEKSIINYYNCTNNLDADAVNLGEMR